MTSGAGSHADIVFYFKTDLVGIGLLITSLQIRYDPFKGALISVTAIIPLIIEGELLLPGTMEKDLLNFFGQVFKRGVDIDLIVPAHGIEHLMKIDGMTVCPRGYGALPEGKFGIRNNHLGVKISFIPEPPAFLTSPMGIVEGEHLGR